MTTNTARAQTSAKPASSLAGLTVLKIMCKAQRKQRAQLAEHKLSIYTRKPRTQTIVPKTAHSSKIRALDPIL